MFGHVLIGSMSYLLVRTPPTGYTHIHTYLHTSYIPPTYLLHTSYIPPTYLLHTSYIPPTYLLHTSYIPPTYLLHTYIPTYIHTYIQTNKQTYKHTTIQPYTIHPYIHTAIHTSFHTSIHTYTPYTYVWTYGKMYVSIHVNTYIHTSIQPYIYTYIHMSFHPSIHPYIYTPIQPYIHPSIHTYNHTYKHACIHAFIHSLMNEWRSCRYGRYGDETLFALSIVEREFFLSYDAVLGEAGWAVAEAWKARTDRSQGLAVLVRSIQADGVPSVEAEAASPAMMFVAGKHRLAGKVTNDERGSLRAIAAKVCEKKLCHQWIPQSHKTHKTVKKGPLHALCQIFIRSFIHSFTHPLIHSYVNTLVH